MDSTLLHQLARFCAYQERCTQDLHRKMQDLGIPNTDYEAYIDWLTAENYFNEKRFAEIYARSKFNQKQWGRNKIRFELKKRNLSAELIQCGLAEIEEQDYLKVLKNLIEKTLQKNRSLNNWEKNQKTVNYLTSRGFELELIVSLIKN